MTQTKPPLLEVKNLRKYFPIRKGFLRRIVGNVRAVDDVSLFINEGETLGLVGESGCGKTRLPHAASSARSFHPAARSTSAPSKGTPSTSPNSRGRNCAHCAGRCR